MSEGSSLLADLRDDAGFQALMEEVKPRWEALREWQRGLDA